MIFCKYLSVASIDLNFNPKILEESYLDQTQHNIYQRVLLHLSHLLAASGYVKNINALYTAMTNNIQRVPANIGEGFAIPHARTMYVPHLIFALLLCPEGIIFETPDDQPVQIFLGMVAPPYYDRLYLKVYRQLASIILNPELQFKTRLLTATSSEQVIQILDECYIHSINNAGESISNLEEDFLVVNKTELC